ncbi:MAG: hypothetical protein QOK44_4129, partial [Betaproteobacteria bacterium]|nr:hypothetical protein [Betaproteobacteria bacterium]
LYAVLGAVLFAAPVQTSTQFAWKVSPFVTMTIGAWCLGNAWAAWVTATRGQWSLVRTVLLYLWLFGLLETGVLLIFRAKVQLAYPFAWLYVVALGVNALAAVWGICEWLRIRPVGRAGETPTVPMRVFIACYVVFVAFLGVFGLARGMVGRGTSGAVFPEAMSAFSLSAFAAFYLALALSALPLLWARDRDTLAHHGYASYALVFIITVATFVYIDRFDFAVRPLGLVYVGAYVLVAIVTAFFLLKYGTGAREGRLAVAST